jgi:hypothetical protein
MKSHITMIKYFQWKITHYANEPEKIKVVQYIIEVLMCLTVTGLPSDSVQLTEYCSTYTTSH